jgi:Fe-S oxidoreductase
MEEFLALLQAHGKQAGVYGHVGSGCMHVRPYVDLRKPEELTTMRALMEATSDLLLKYHGSLSGEHGDGIVRSWLNEKMFGPKLYQAFKDLKQVFDPAGGMNPGKIIAAQGLDENLRMSPKVKPLKIQTIFDFTKQGGLALAADLCNGNGLCRKREGLMCPSFQAYGDEFHSTRARAQGLRSIINGKLPAEAFTGHDLYHVLEYCLECKGCKTECPSQVDMAKMKSEFLYHYQEKHGYSLRSKLFAHLATINRLAAPIASVFNAINRSWLGKTALKWLGITPHRNLPPLSKQRFSQQIAKAQSTVHSNSVVLFIDTYTEFHHPEIGLAAHKVLQAMGYHVICPTWKCCGRPLISKGFLKEAQVSANNLIASLLPYAELGLPIIGLEPSCLSTLTDDYKDLIPGEASQLIAQHALSFDTFVANAVKQGNAPWKQQVQQVSFHTHCHQKSLEGSAATQAVLSSLPGAHVDEIRTGCCGLAGSFGYETEHYDFSMKIGETQLFPAVRALNDDTLIVANGMSCRCQIAHGTERQAVHLAELLARSL